MNKSFFSLAIPLILFSCISSNSKMERNSNTDRLPSSKVTQRIDDIAFAESDEINTDALVIIKDGQTLFEKYDRNYESTKKHLSWSMAKSISGMIAAQAIEEGYLKMNDSLHKWIPNYTGSATVQDAFQMSTGIRFKEEYSGIPVDSDATKMLYLKGPTKGFANYVAALPKRDGVSPGNHFYYSSGDTNLIMEAVKNSINNKQVYDNYPWTSFFDKIDIQDATFEQDSKGTFVGSSYIYLSTESYIKIAQLIMNKGRLNNQQIIPIWYFDMMTQVAPGVEAKALDGTSQTRAYSMQITTNRPIPGRALTSEYADLPTDSLLMIGHQGQFVITSPSEKLIIVRLATDKGNPFNSYRNQLFAEIKKLIQASGLSLKVAGSNDQLHFANTPTDNKKNKTALTEYLKVPQLMKSLYAKELCSCIFVTDRNLDQCKQDMKTSLPFLPLVSINHKKKKTSASFVLVDQIRATYINEKLGCTLAKK